MRREHAHRPKDEQEKEQDCPHNLLLKGHQRGPAIENPFCNHAREHGALREQQRSEGIQTAAQKSETARPVWMGGNEV